MEEWKPIIITKKGVVYDYTGLYEVSNLGRIRSLNYGRTGETKILKLNTTKKKGYTMVDLVKNKKHNQFSVHRCVAFAFIPNPENKPYVNHINENKTDNRAVNLEWVTQSENMLHGTCPQRLSKALKGKPKSEQHKRKISESLKHKKS